MEIKSFDTIHYVAEYKVKLNGHYDFDGYEERHRIVMERNPLAQEHQLNKKDFFEIARFQFYDVEVITTDSGEKYFSKPKNYSPIFYTGNRVTLEEFDNRFGRFGWKLPKNVTSLIHYPKTLNLSVNLTQETEGITIDEYKEQQLTMKNTRKH